MRPSRYLAALVIVLLVHSIALRLAPSLVVYLDFFAILVVLNGLDGDSLGGLLGGLVAGLIQDSLTVGLFGLYGCANTLIGYAAAKVVQRLVIERAIGVLPLVAGAVLAQQLIVLGLTAILLPSPPFPAPLVLLLKAVACGILGSLLYSLAGWWRGSSDRRRRRRMDRLQMG
ncbi:MAG: rod shape-determining protein MreD [Acidobacteriota bacterium]